MCIALTGLPLTTFAASLSFLSLLGITWIFGLIAAADPHVVWQYLFAVTNTLQGLFLFIFHCVLNKNVQAALKLAFCGREDAFHRGASPNPKSTRYEVSKTGTILPSKGAKSQGEAKPEDDSYYASSWEKENTLAKKTAVLPKCSPDWSITSAIDLPSKPVMSKQQADRGEGDYLIIDMSAKRAQPAQHSLSPPPFPPPAPSAKQIQGLEKMPEPGKHGASPSSRANSVYQISMVSPPKSRSTSFRAKRPVSLNLAGSVRMKSLGVGEYLLKSPERPTSGTSGTLQSDKGTLGRRPSSLLYESEGSSEESGAEGDVPSLIPRTFPSISL